MGAKFEPGKNIAQKVPKHEFHSTVRFYRDILGLSVLEGAWSPDSYESIAFDFNGKNLWIDCISTLSQAEIWLEITTNNVQEAKEHLVNLGCTICDEIEPLPDSFKGFWVSSPSNLIHLINE